MSASRAFVCAGVLALAACSGGQGVAPSAGLASGTVAFTFGTGAASAAVTRPAFLSPSASSVSIKVSGVPSPVVGDVSGTSPDCTGSGATRTCDIAVKAPLGTDTFTATLYTGPGATGQVLGVGTSSQSVSGGSFSITMTVDGSAGSIALSVATTTLTPGTPLTQPLTVTVKDAGGNVITGTYAKAITLTNSDTSGTFALSTTTVTSSTQIVTLAYNGGASVSTATIGATAPGVPTGSVLSASVALSSVFVEYATATAGAGPARMALGPDGAVWFMETGVNKIGRVATSGATSDFAVPTAGAVILSSNIANGPDGNLYFTEYGSSNVARITTAGAITEFPIPSGAVQPSGITSGPDGNVWFSEHGASQIGRLNLPGGSITEFVIPTASSDPSGIVAGPDGALWFGELTARKIGRVTTSGTFTEYPLPAGTGDPDGLAVGSDGAIWFTEENGAKIGRITTAGAITEFPITAPGSNPIGMAAGPDGNLYFADEGANALGRITTAGAITEFPMPTAASDNLGVAPGSDGNVWFSENAPSKVGKFVL